MPVAVYGATGFTGRLVIDELGKRGIECVAGGRNPRRVAALAERHPHVADARAAEASDRSAMRALLDGCDAVVNCAGPLAELAAPVACAAIDAGVHYADPAGEQGVICDMFERHGRAAARRGVALVPAMGFDYAPGDCIARLAAAGHEPLREIVVAYSIAGAGTARDSLGASGATTAGREVVYEGGGWRPAPGGVQRVSFRFPAPLGRQTMQRYGSGEAITVPRHTRTRAVRTLITASTWSPHPSLTPLVPYLRPLAARVRRSPLRPVLELAARGAPEAASDGRDGAGGAVNGGREDGRFVIAAIAHGEDGTSGSGIVEGGGFHVLTARVLAEGAARLAAGTSVTGTASAATAFDPADLLDSLTSGGYLRWSVA